MTNRKEKPKVKRVVTKNRGNKRAAGRRTVRPRLQRDCLLILGMHRSGTSALTRVLNVMGASLPRNIMGAGLGNEDGHWESETLVTYHDQLLEKEDSHWHDWQALRVLPSRQKEAAIDIQALVESEYGPAPLFVLKDPRICRFVPIYLEALKGAGIAACPVMIFRNPLDVIDSLRRRAENWGPKFTRADAALLWLRYVLEAEHATRGMARTFLSFEDLLEDWRGVVTRVQETFNLPFMPMEEIGPEIDAFISPDKRHHARRTVEIVLDPLLRDWVGEAWEAYLLLTRNPKSKTAMARLDRVAEAFNGASPVLQAFFEEVHQEHGQETGKLSDAIAQKEKDLEALAEAKSQLEASLSERGEAVSQLQVEWAALNEQVAAMEARVAAQQEEISALRQLSSDKDEVISARDKVVAEMERALQHMQEQLDQAKGEAGQLEATLAKRGEEVAALREELDARVSDLATAQQQMVDKDRALDDIKTILAERDAALAAREESLKEKEQALESLREEFEQAQTEAGQLEATLAKRGEEVAALREELDARVSDLASRGGEVAELRKMLEEQKRDSVRQQETHLQLLSEMQQVIAERDASLGMREQSLLDKDADLQALRQQLKAVREELDYFKLQKSLSDKVVSDLKNSTSWRLTRPLRMLARRFGISLANTSVRDLAISQSEGGSQPSPDKKKESLTARNKDLCVSVIVPNYNHAPFLRQRLNSIYAQSYQNIEVILLDDCSTDNSREILQEYHDRYRDRTKLIFNGQNSGSVFRQWAKGLAAASGDVVWIAESDDWCDLDFLEKLIPAFADESVLISYARTSFMSDDGKSCIWSIEEFLDDINSERWRNQFVESTYRLVVEGWGRKNIIPNVSSAIFRKPNRPSLFKDPDWLSMKICGDWFFYLNFAAAGKVSYTPKTTNYHRMHASNTSTATYAKDSYYREHAMVAKSMMSLFDVPDSLLDRTYDALRDHWRRYRSGDPIDRIDDLYDVKAIRRMPVFKKPTLMMAVYAFAAGGGETFPLNLANLFHRRGYPVLVLSYEQEESEDGIREMLHEDIPVFTDYMNINDIIQAHNVDIVHSHHAWVDNVILDFLPDSLDVGTVVSMHGMYEMLIGEGAEKTLSRVVSRSGALVYAAEKNVQPFKQLNIFTEQKFYKIANALDDQPVHPVSRRSMGISEEAFVLCLVSRALSDKGWAEAVEAVRMVRKDCDADIHLILIGEGEEYDRLIAQESLPYYIHLLGFKKNIRDFYAMADFGFLPTRFKGESYPLCIIDSLKAGTPVLASNVGEIGEMICCEGVCAGVLFDLVDWEIDVAGLAEQIKSLAHSENKARELRENTKIVAEKFSPEKLFQNYDNVYRNVLSGLQRYA